MSDQNGEDLSTRLLRLSEECPALLPYLVETIEMLEGLDVDVEDITTVMRVYRKSPSLVHLVSGMMDIAISLEHTRPM